MVVIEVSSHRRSGTHALIDTIRQFLDVEDHFLHLEDLIDAWDSLEGNVLVKTHEPYPTKKMKLFIEQGRISERKASEINSHIKRIHIHRSPYDVLRSLYYFNLYGHEPIYKITSDCTFMEFLRQEGVQDADTGENRVEFWCRCMENWVINDPVSVFSYEDLVNNPIAVAKHISEKMEVPFRKVGVSTRSTAVGRNTTRSMADRETWSRQAYKEFNSMVDHNILKRVGYAVKEL